ncbi:IS1096 element passenger TnpR family protein [Variovorax guangxiensis]|uniref:IS1096 element passenger TnpR family protein n=1 Tax=Variovorax guangxiensis TaxID=1775474 RepID=UPI0038F68595
MQCSKVSFEDGTGASSAQEVLQLRAVLRSISPLIWRRILVRGDSSVARLYQILQVAFGRRAAWSSTPTRTKP